MGFSKKRQRSTSKKPVKAKIDWYEEVSDCAARLLAMLFVIFLVWGCCVLTWWLGIIDTGPRTLLLAAWIYVGVAIMLPKIGK